MCALRETALHSVQNGLGVLKRRARRIQWAARVYAQHWDVKYNSGPCINAPQYPTIRRRVFWPKKRVLSDSVLLGKPPVILRSRDSPCIFHLMAAVYLIAGIASACSVMQQTRDKLTGPAAARGVTPECVLSARLYCYKSVPSGSVAIACAASLKSRLKTPTVVGTTQICVSSVVRSGARTIRTVRHHSN